MAQDRRAHRAAAEIAHLTKCVPLMSQVGPILEWLTSTDVAQGLVRVPMAIVREVAVLALQSHDMAMA